MGRGGKAGQELFCPTFQRSRTQEGSEMPGNSCHLEITGPGKSLTAPSEAVALRFRRQLPAGIFPEPRRSGIKRRIWVPADLPLSPGFQPPEWAWQRSHSDRSRIVDPYRGTPVKSTGWLWSQSLGRAKCLYGASAKLSRGEVQPGRALAFYPNHFLLTQQVQLTSRLLQRYLA